MSLCIADKLHTEKGIKSLQTALLLCRRKAYTIPGESKKVYTFKEL